MVTDDTLILRCTGPPVTGRERDVHVGGAMRRSIRTRDLWCAPQIRPRPRRLRTKSSVGDFFSGWELAMNAREAAGIASLCTEEVV